MRAFTALALLALVSGCGGVSDSDIESHCAERVWALPNFTQDVCAASVRAERDAAAGRGCASEFEAKFECASDCREVESAFRSCMLHGGH